tara:strand:+ start:192 stop:467 length:276 start_codon:yes stop_codon:yes gene_type:complete
MEKSSLEELKETYKMTTREALRAIYHHSVTREYPGIWVDMMEHVVKHAKGLPKEKAARLIKTKKEDIAKILEENKMVEAAENNPNIRSYRL